MYKIPWAGKGDAGPGAVSKLSWRGGLKSFLALCLLTMIPVVQQSSSMAAPRKQPSTLPQDSERLQQELDNTRRELEALKKQRAGTSAEAPAMDFFLAGLAYIGLQKYPEAVAAFSRSIDRAPQDGAAFRHRGIAYLYLNDLTPALTDLHKAIELDAQDAVAYNYRGIVYYAQDNAAQALTNFDKALDLQPKFAEAYNNRGIAHYRLGNYRSANKDFEAAGQAGMSTATQHLQTVRDEVKKVQERLQAVGLSPGPADGVPGQQTVNALRQYQGQQGLPATGLGDDATRRALGIAIATPGSAASTLSPRFVHHPEPEYPQEARAQGLEGTVTLRLELMADGTIGRVEVAQSSGHAVLDTAARDAVKAWRHTPAVKDGTAVTEWVDLTFTFALEKGREAAKP